MGLLEKGELRSYGFLWKGGPDQLVDGLGLDDVFACQIPSSAVHRRDQACYREGPETQLDNAALTSISIVSHAQADLVSEILSDLSGFADPANFEIILTKNIPERLAFGPEGFPYSVRVIENVIPKGFGANHNAAFQIANGEWFCVMNPDIRMPENPFPVLLEEIERHHAAAIAPAILSPAGRIEDSIRRFPTPLSLAGKLLGRSDGRYPFALGDGTFANRPSI